MIGVMLHNTFYGLWGHFGGISLTNVDEHNRIRIGAKRDTKSAQFSRQRTHVIGSLGSSNVHQYSIHVPVSSSYIVDPPSTHLHRHSFLNFSSEMSSHTGSSSPEPLMLFDDLLLGMAQQHDVLLLRTEAQQSV